MRPENEKLYELTLRLHGEEAAEEFRQLALKDEYREEVREGMRDRRMSTSGPTGASSGCALFLFLFVLVLASTVAALL